MSSNLHPKFGHEHVRILSRKPLHAGYLRVDELILRHRLFAGGDSELFRRELIVRPRGVCVLIYSANSALEKAGKRRTEWEPIVEGNNANLV